MNAEQQELKIQQKDSKALFDKIKLSNRKVVKPINLLKCVQPRPVLPGRTVHSCSREHEKESNWWALIVMMLWPCLSPVPWRDWTDSGQGLAWPWQPPAASCQSAAREDRVKVRAKHQREHVNTPNEKDMAGCARTGEEREWWRAPKLITRLNDRSYRML